MNGFGGGGLRLLSSLIFSRFRQFLPPLWGKGAEDEEALNAFSHEMPKVLPIKPKSRQNVNAKKNEKGRGASRA